MTAVALSLDDEMIDPSLAQARRRKSIVFASQITISAAFIIFWEIISPHLDHAVFSSPLDIVARTWQWAQDGTLLSNLLVTGEEIILGYVTGAVAAIFLGLLLGSYPLIARILDPLFMAIYGVPKIAFGPLFIVWFGINLTPKVVICALTVFFFIFFATYEGARAVDRALLRTIRLMGASPLQERLLVVIPGSMPAIRLGLKLAIPEALVGAILGELIVSNRGIGYLIEFSATQLDSAGVFAGLFILMALAVIANSAVHYAAGRTAGETD